MSSEISDVLEAIETLSARGERMALATIVSVRGSTYRRPGARLLVPESGDLIGNISGGCLEGDVQEVAHKVMGEGGQATLVDFDLTADDEAVWGWGLGCNGAVELFVEPAEKAADVSGDLRRALEEEREIIVVTVLDPAGTEGVERGARLLVHPDGRRERGLGNPAADDAATGAALEAFRNGASIKREITVGTSPMVAFVEVLEPSPRLLICGAGHDAIPVVRFAAQLGWRPYVIDDRDRFLTSERFPEAAGFIPLSRPTGAAEATGTDGRTFVLVMSHNYLRDKDYIRSYLGTDVAYIGSLGPRKRLDSVLTDLQKEGVAATPEDLAKIYAPSGLDIGAEGPEEVAWAIMAEVIAVRAGRGAGFLRDRRGHIHPRAESPSTPEGGASRSSPGAPSGAGSEDSTTTDGAAAGPDAQPAPPGPPQRATSRAGAA
ncbi:MAG TPA: XdhC family protein [Actinomycetota bacterium]|nr:XdhC family protein [Actinomycetota bacterium]